MFAVNEALHGTGDAVGVVHAAPLIEYGEAMLGRDAARAALARDAVYRTLGPAALVDAAAIVASFNAVVKLADGSGIPLEELKAEATQDLRQQLALERLNHLDS